MYKKNSDIIEVQYGDILCLSKSGVSDIYSLNEVGQILWNNLDKAMSDIIFKIVEEYDIDESTVENDISELIADLLSEKLIYIAE